MAALLAPRPRLGCCELCGDAAGRRLCARCLERFAPLRPRCLRCAIGLPAGLDLCGACRVDPPAFERAVCVADYGFPWDRLIAGFKYRDGSDLADIFAECLAAQAGDAPLPDLLAPVPLSDSRLAERGYDQAWELARRLARRWHRPAQPRLLLRRFDLGRQAQSDRRQRLANLRGAFVLAPGQQPAIQHRHVGLVDDVLTTGATAQAAARVLLDQGAARVSLWVVARTPDPAAPASP